MSYRGSVVVGALVAALVAGPAWAGHNTDTGVPRTTNDVPYAAAPWATFTRPTGEDCVKKGAVTLPGVPASTQLAINIRWRFGDGTMSSAYVGTGENPEQDWSHTYDVSRNYGIFPEGAFELQVEDDTVLGDFRTQAITVPPCVTPPPVTPEPVTPTPSVSAETTPSANETTATPVATQQSVQGLKSLRKGKRVALAKTTQQGVAVSWKAEPRKVCRVKAFKVKAFKKGTCTLTAKAPAATGLLPLVRAFAIRVK